jgi:hypothetical protein
VFNQKTKYAFTFFRLMLACTNSPKLQWDYLKIICARGVTWSNFHTQDPHISRTTTQNSVAVTTWSRLFVYICFNDLHSNCTLFVLQLYIRRSLNALRETQCTFISYRWAEPGGLPVSDVCLRPLACWDCVFEFRRVLICVVCCECLCVIR